MLGRRVHLTSWMLLAAVAVQVAVWWGGREVRETYTVVPPAPSERAVKALAFGDQQFLFRHLALDVQHFGDTGGHNTPLVRYDYERLVGWFDRLDDLDPVSDFPPALAAYLFGQSTRPDQVRQIALYLQQHARLDPMRKWRWLTQGALLARHRGQDLSLALRIARDLQTVVGPDIPAWTRQMPALLLADVGESQAARDLMAVILATDPRLTEAEKNYAHDFIARMDRQIATTNPRKEQKSPSN